MLGGALAWCPSLRARPFDTVYFGGTCLPEGVERDELVKILGAELSPSVIAPLRTIPGQPDDAVVLAIDRCVETPPSVRISVWHGAERRERVVVLADVPPEDRTRTLALALAETRSDPTVSRPAAPEAAPPALEPPAVVPLPHPVSPPMPVTQPTPTREPSSFAFRASLAFRYATETSTPAGGIFLGVGWPRFGAGASVFGARQSVPIGQITLWVTSATAYYDAVQFSERLRLRGTLDLGFAIASGVPRAPARAETQAAFDAALHAGLVATLFRGTANDVEAALAVGYSSSLRARADGKDAVGLDGLLLTAGVGLGFR
ncbi:MAG TPA: hypothetical protein VHC69_32480 [Polyangiaceae bacterium]|nr:hypothetical protein [Polyangiaceae bacterium]